MDESREDGKGVDRYFVIARSPLTSGWYSWSPDVGELICQRDPCVVCTRCRRKASEKVDLGFTADVTMGLRVKR